MSNAQGGRDRPIADFNISDPNGGNSLTQDLNVYYDSGDTAWMLVATALVMLMIPGVG